MPNAKDARDLEESPDRFLLLGTGGAGKTSEILTLPGRKFVYVFDPNCIASLEGHDVDYEKFLVDADDVDLAVKSLSTGKGDTSSRRISPQTYINWEKHFETNHAAGFFNNYDWIGFDSFTMFLEMVMDRILFINGRTGKQPEQADWAAQVNTVGNVFRVIAAMNIGILCNGHLDERQDELTKRIWMRPMMTGRLRIRVPLLFNHVLVCHSDTGVFTVQTQSDKTNPFIRTAFKGLSFEEDVTIKDFNKPGDYGLGALLKKAGRGPAATKPTAKAAVQPRRR